LRVPTDKGDGNIYPQLTNSKGSNFGSSFFIFCQKWQRVILRRNVHINCIVKGGYAFEKIETDE